jgi:hypothetical protein
MMGQIEEWFYQSLAGIVSDEAHPGFKHFFIQPEIVGDMTFVKASYQSVYGKIVSDWEKREDKTIFEIEIPANTTATVVLPVDKESKITVNAKVLKRFNLEEKTERPTFELGSGNYTIQCSLEK